MKLNIYIRIRHPKTPLEAEPEACYSVSDSCYMDLTACIAIELTTPTFHITILTAKYFTMHTGSTVLPIVNALYVAFPLSTS